MLREGPFLAAPEEIEDINEYGISWEVNEEPELIAHLLENNLHEHLEADHDPFAPSRMPANLSEVLCEPPNCPFTQLSFSFLIVLNAQAGNGPIANLGVWGNLNGDNKPPTILSTIAAAVTARKTPPVPTADQQEEIDEWKALELKARSYLLPTPSP
ncbi:hypothetical protein B0H13DRAFT_2334039 [Mycena leptocephala]|nr:hypothetical protein B0H13DRAFT_2334039 [Mycena leptocephala]